MGQYYKPCFLGDNNNVKLYFYSHDADCGLKLMEHSYVRNTMCVNVAYSLIDSPKRLVWAGDYADTWDGMEDNHYDMCDESKKAKMLEFETILTEVEQHPIYINHTKQQWFDITKQVIPAYSGWSGKVHPLPILTADGNGRGGGDYHGAHEELVGTWKGDLIEVSDTIPSNYKEIEPWFTEMSQKEIDEYFKELVNPKKKYTIKINYTTSEEFVVEAHTEEEALQLVEDMNPDETQVYENLTLNGSPRVVGCE